MFSKIFVRSNSTIRFIKNIKYPVCKYCLYFRHFIPIENDNNLEYSKIGVCMKFGEKNMINGKIKYISVINCRNDASKCRKVALYFNLLNPK